MARGSELKKKGVFCCCKKYKLKIFSRSFSFEGLFNQPIEIHSFSFAMVSADSSSADVTARFQAIHARLDALEAALKGDYSSAASKNKSSNTIKTGDHRDGKLDDDDSTETSTLSIPSTSASPASDTQRRLSEELLAQGIPQDRFAFTRVPGDYYDHSLDYRRECLRAAALSRLCKTLLMENTKAKKFNERDEVKKNAEITPSQRAALSEHFLVIVQYEDARFDAERRKRERVKRAGGFAPAKAFNLRLAKDGVAEAMTGFVPGAVTPVGALCGLLGSHGQKAVASKRRQGGGGGEGEGEEIPVVLSSRVARLPEFWMGGGEVDLKLCVSTKDFIRAYDPIVADVIHGDEGGEEGGDEE